MTQRIEGGSSPDESKKIPGTPSLPDDIQIQRPSSHIESGSLAASQTVAGITGPSQPVRLAPYNNEGISQLLSSTAQEAEQINSLLLIAEKLDPEQAPNLNEWAAQHSQELVEIALKRMEAAEDWTEASEGALKLPETGIELAEKYIAFPLEFIAAPLGKMENIAEPLSVGIMDAQLAIKVPVILGNTSNLIYKRIVLKHLGAQQIKMEQSSDPVVVEKAIKLKGWVELQDLRLTKESLSLGLELLVYTPKGLKAVLVTMDKFSHFIAYGDLWMSAITGLLLNGYRVYQTSQVIKTQAKWLEEIRQSPIVPQPISATGVPEEMKHAVKTLLDKRQKAFSTKKQQTKTEFSQWIYDALSRTSSMDTLSPILREKGVRLDSFDPPIRSREDLFALLERDPARTDQLLSQYVEHKQTISVLTKQGLKTLSEKKQRIEKSINRFQYKKAIGSFTISGVIFATMLTLKTLVLAAVITLPAIAIASTGVGVFSLGILVVAIGLIALYRTKPHLFKEFFHGTQLRLSLYAVPHAFQNFQLHLKQISQLKHSIRSLEFRAQAQELQGILEQSQTVDAAKLPPDLLPLFKKLKAGASKMLTESDMIEANNRLKEIVANETKIAEAEQAKLNQAVEDYQEKVAVWKKRMAPLKQRLAIAGTQDFARTSKLAKDRFGNPLKFEEVLVEGLFNDPSLLDDSVSILLERELGIDLKALRNRPDLAEVKQDVLEALRTFFGMDNTAIASFIEEQQAKVKYV
jgi:hypothetical protein